MNTNLNSDGCVGANASWQPIATAPKDGTSILLTDGQHVFEGSWVSRALFGAHGWYDVWGEAYAGTRAKPIACTHWMPLPDPPMATTMQASDECACSVLMGTYVKGYLAKCFPCANPATTQVDGKWFCEEHKPEAAA